jgi:hypothetical protein
MEKMQKETCDAASMLASVELKKRENCDDLDFLQMNGYIPCSIYIVSR